MKVFISQPMKGLTDEQILYKRELIKKEVKEKYRDVEFIETFLDISSNYKPLYYLSKSIELLSTADLLVSAKDWDLARGCKLENNCAREYGIKVMYSKN